MTTLELTQQTADWLNSLNTVHGWDGVVHEVASVLSENAHFSSANRRYRQQLAETVTTLQALYDRTGSPQLIDAANDIRKLIEWCDSGLMPVQLALFAMPGKETAS